MNNPKIDIVIPNFNKSEYLRQCLNSLINQSFSEWRCIFIDGYSDDGSWEIALEFSRNDKRFELIQLPRKGIYNAWNYGLSQVNAPFFCILTSDDIWSRDWLQIAIDCLENNDKVVCSAARVNVIKSLQEIPGKGQEVAIFNLIGERFFQTDLTKPEYRNGLVDCIANYFLGPIYTSIHALVMRSHILKQGAKFAEDLGPVADREWYLKLGLYGDIIYHPNVTVGWRLYEGQATNPKNPEDQETMFLWLSKICSRNRETIASYLGSNAEAFILEATKYEENVLSYKRKRPPIANIFATPLSQSVRLLMVFLTMPGKLSRDIFLKALGSSFYQEESLKAARKASEKCRLAGSI